MLKRTWTAVLLVVLMVAAALPAVAADSGAAPEAETSYELTQFDDIAGNTFENAINWLVDQGITVGCNPPSYTNFCPGDPVTRGQMAVFITRALSLPAAADDYFDDDNGAFYENSANRLFEAGISVGCNPPANNNFCGGDEVTRAQMATFLTRGFGLTATNVDYFTDDDGSVHETSINRVRSANITVGCNPPASDNFCPGDTVTRGQMSAFIKRAVDWLANPTTPPPPPGTPPPSSFSCATQGAIPKAECDALVAFYNATGGSQWTVRTGWLSGNPCTWEGVDCGAGRVQVLDLDSNNLTGTIPNLTALGQLVELNLAGNFIGGSIPSSFGNLTSLQTLSLDANQFTGGIPSQLGNLSNLRFLDLADNSGMSGPLHSNLQNLQLLQELDLSSTPITGSVPTWIGSLDSLTDLDLADTDLTGPLPNEIGGMAMLQELDLAESLISGPVPAAISNLGDTLTQLDMADMPNMSGGIGFVASLVNLVTLDLDGSNFEGTIPAGIGAIGNSLTSLDLSFNSLGGDVPVEIQLLTNPALVGGLFLDNQAGALCFSFSDDTPGMAGPTRDWVLARDAAADVCAVPPAPEPTP